MDTQPLERFFANARSFITRHRRPIAKASTLESLLEAKHVNVAGVQKCIQSTRIIVHPSVVRIAKDFLHFKRIHGTKIEKSVYTNQIEWNSDRFFARLIQQRPLAFLGSSDTTLLRTHKFIPAAFSEWDRVGSHDEHPELTMNDYLTYEEIMISSLIGVSGYTIYLNDGSRYNRGVLKLSDDIQYEGIQLGLVGARFERQGRMDTLYVLDEAPHAQSFPFASYFAGETFEARYKSRIRITVETMLLEAQQRGLEEGKAVYVHVVGLGLGVWAVHEDQPQWYIEVFTKCLAALDVSRIDVLEFAWIDVDDTTEEDLEAVASKKGITCLFSRANPSKKLADDSLLLVTTYAWDGNAYPGNEYYLGQLTASGDPAAACSTTIAETHNPEINTEMLKSIHYFKL